MKNTIVVNLFGGPGVGKSTGAAYIFSKLKLLGIEVEYVTEYAKDKVWEHNDEVFKCQLYITGKQTFKIHRVCGKVDVIITDSPIAIGAQYCDEKPIRDVILYEFSKYNNLNIYLNRIFPYSTVGRNQTEDEAKEIDRKTLNWLNEAGLEYDVFDAEISGYDRIVNLIYNKVMDMKFNTKK